jgi:hypothetical protein
MSASICTFPPLLVLYDYVSGVMQKIFPTTKPWSKARQPDLILKLFPSSIGRGRWDGKAKEGMGETDSDGIGLP